MTDLMKKQKGFTLIELIVVIAVLAILAAILLPRFMGFTNTARHNATLSEAKNIGTAVEAITAEGKYAFDAAADNDDETQVLTYMGKNAFPAGTTLSITSTNGDFTYTKTWSGKTWSAAYDHNTGNITVTDPS